MACELQGDLRRARFELALNSAFSMQGNPLSGKYPREPLYDRLFTRITMHAPAPIGLGPSSTGVAPMHFMRPAPLFGLFKQGLRNPKSVIASAAKQSIACGQSCIHGSPLRCVISACLVLAALPGLASAEEFPTISPSQLPGSLQELYAQEQPGLGQYGHCAAGFDSRTDGLKMALSCSIYVRSSAQGARLAVKLCNERAAFLKIKARCKLIVD